MQKLNIMAVSTQPDTLEVLLRLINKEENWVGVGADSDEYAIELHQTRIFEVILLGSGLDDATEQKLIKLFKHQDPDVIIIRHYGGGSGLLYNEIQQALSARDAGRRWQVFDAAPRL